MHPDAAKGRNANEPVRLCLSSSRGDGIDGAWWPRVDRMTLELPQLVKALTPVLDDITAISVNWPSLERPPDLNWFGWQHKPQHIMTVSGRLGRVNLLIVPYQTQSGLAMMVLRRAAGLPIDPDDLAKPAYLTAGRIVRAARLQWEQQSKTSGSDP